MTADDMIENGREAAILALYRRLEPREQRAFEDALLRWVAGGQPFDEAMEEFLVECGVPCAEARKQVREALAETRDGDWRAVLN